MKKIQILAIVLLSVISTSIYAQSESEQMVVQLSNPGSPGTLDISLVTGSIHVVGGDNDDVVIIDAASKNQENSRRQRERTDGLKRINGSQGFEISAKEVNNTVTVGTGSPNQNLTLTLQVPMNFSLKLRTVNRGDITVKNVNGNLETSNVNGEITLTDVSGSVLANTINGDIKVNFNSVNSETPMAFTTLNGDVDLTFPASLKADLKANSQRGDILSDFDIELSTAAPEVVRTSEGNMQQIKRGGWTLGKINGGGSEIMMKTMNGDILIRKGE